MDPVVNNLAALVTKQTGRMIIMSINFEIASNDCVFHDYTKLL